jgi:hypothetical protein
MDRTGAILCSLSAQLITDVSDEKWANWGFRHAIQPFAVRYHYVCTVAPVLRGNPGDFQKFTSEVFEDTVLQMNEALKTHDGVRFAISKAFWHLVFAVADYPPAKIEVSSARREQRVRREQFEGLEQLIKLTKRLAGILTQSTQPDAAIFLAVRKTLLTLMVGLLVVRGLGWNIKVMRQDLGTVFAYVYAFALNKQELSFPACKGLAHEQRGLEFMRAIFQIMENPNFDLAAEELNKALTSALEELEV